MGMEGTFNGIFTTKQRTYMNIMYCKYNTCIGTTKRIAIHDIDTCDPRNYTEITNGSVVIFRSPDNGNVVNAGVVIFDIPKILYDKIDELTPNKKNRGENCRIPEAAGQAMLKEFEHCYRAETFLNLGVLRPFLLLVNNADANNPYVHVSPFWEALRNHNGDVGIRISIIPTLLRHTNNFLERHIGKSYIQFPTQHYEVYSSKRVSCGNLLGLFYAEALDKTNVFMPYGWELITRFRDIDSVTADNFGLLAENENPNDILSDLAFPEFMLKHVTNTERVE
jgi:hypothetical protein